MRVTWQVTPRNKISGFWDEQANCRTCTGLTTGITDPPRVSPEARGTGQTKPLRVPQVTWSSPVTSKLLLDAGFGGVYYGWGNFERNPEPDARSDQHGRAVRAELREQRQRTRGPGLPVAGLRHQHGGVVELESVDGSYVTGANSLKIGYQGTLMTDYRTWGTNSQNLSFRVNNGVPEPDHASSSDRGRTTATAAGTRSSRRISGRTTT